MILIKNGRLHNGLKRDILVSNGKVALIDEDIAVMPEFSVIDATEMIVAPGLVDMHVHFREPGFEYKEDILSGAAAAAAGGITACCFMANTMPVLDNADILNSLIGKVKSASVKCFPVGAVTLGLQGEKLTDFAALKLAGAVALSDDGVPIRSSTVMEAALRLAEKLNLPIISHCESETEMAERDISLAGRVGARIHIAHVSLADTVDVIRSGKARGVRVTAETCPHYFSLSSDEVTRQGAQALMNPPLASERDIKAIVRGLCDGTIDVIATDHAPHSAEEKALPPGEAPFGIIGLETSLGVTLTHLYCTGLLGLSDIVRLMSGAPAEILSIDAGKLNVGSPADIVVFDPSEQWVVQPQQFKSKAQNTPFGGMTLKGKVKHTLVDGEIV